MKSRLMTRLLTMALLAVPLVACSAEVAKTKDAVTDKASAVTSSVEAQIRKQLQERYADSTIGKISKTPLAGLYEVEINRDVIYVDEKARYIFVGDLLDLQNKKNLSEPRRQELSKVNFEALPKDLAFTVVKGDGRRKVAIFTDPDCPYCHKIEQEVLRDITDVTIYYYLMPLDFHPDAARKSSMVWCSSNRQQAWLDLMLAGKESPASADKNCKAPLDKVALLARQYGVRGTPGIIFPNGQLVPGAPAKAQFEEALEQSNASAAPASVVLKPAAK